MIRRGVTLLELLAVVGALAVLLGLLFPVLRSARRSAEVAVDISNLRQIGHALRLYDDEWGVENAVSTQALTAGGTLPVALLDSPLDPTLRGIANENRAKMGRSRTNYRDCYLSISDENGPTVVKRVLETRGAGILVALGEGHAAWQQSPPDLFAYRGDYLRLLTDGSAAHRKRPWRLRKNARAPDDVEEQAYWRFTDDPDAVRLRGL